MSPPASPTLSFRFRSARSPRVTAADLVIDELARDGERRSNASARDVFMRLPRVTRLLALAHRFAQLIERGDARSMADLARAGRVSRARVTQIMNLMFLSPDIQAAVLSLEPVRASRDPVILREICHVAGALDWTEQRRRWSCVALRRQLA